MLCPSCNEILQRIFSPPNINLNSGSLAAIGRSSSELRLIKGKLEPAKPKSQRDNQGRPWMFSHVSKLMNYVPTMICHIAIAKVMVTRCCGNSNCNG